MVDFPVGTIHVAVVDPGVGSERALVAVEMGRWRFVAPDNGLLTAVAARYPPQRIIRLTQSRFWREPVSNTFHGRDILAPVAAHLSNGVDILDLGEVQSSLVTIRLPMASREQHQILGEITHIDRFGNLVTSIHASWLANANRERIEIECSSETIRGLQSHYANAETDSLLALIGSSGRLERAATAMPRNTATVGHSCGSARLIASVQLDRTASEINVDERSGPYPSHSADHDEAVGARRR
jgi:S-adenosylmethionine hydrolase